jgi:hypothetical protein
MEPFGNEKSFKLATHGNNYQGLEKMVGEPYSAQVGLLAIMP